MPRAQHITVTVYDRAARSVVAALTSAATSDALKHVAGRAGANTVKTHLRGLEATRPNRLGGTRSHWYAGAARATSHRTAPDGAIVSVSQVGFRMRLLGGTITPKRRKALTIPARPEAYGRTAREIPNLFVLRWRGGKKAALARREGKTLRIWFWLVKRATIRPDPSLLPTSAAIGSAVRRAIDSFLARQIQRAQKPPR